MLLRAISTPDGQVGTEGSALTALTIASMESAAPILQYAQFYSMQGNADNLTKPSTMAGGSERDINDDYDGETTEREGVDLTLRIMGDKVKTDVALSRRGYTIQDERVRQLESFSKGLGRHLTNRIVNGSGNSGQITGLTTLITGAQVKKFVGDNGGQVNLGNSDTAKAQQQAFLEALDELIQGVDGGAEVLVMNYKAIARLKAIAREYVTLQTVESFGFKTVLDTYNGVPIINAGYAKDGSTLIIPSTETLGTASGICTSIYALRFGEKENLTYATNKGVQVKDMGVVGVHYTTLVDFDIEQSLVNPKAAARLKGVILP